MIQYYLRLGLEPGASFDEIKDSFRQMAKRYHPDAGGGNALMFARIKEAYDALSNNEQRAQFEKIYQGSQHHQSVWENLMRRVSKLKEKTGWNTRPAQPEQSTKDTRQTFRPESRTKAQTTANPDTARATGARTNPAQNDKEPAVSRIMSIALPRGGQMVLEDIPAQWIVEPTTPDTLWETTLNKFGKDDLERLSQHVIQMRVTGKRSLARGVELRATDSGVCARTMAGNKDKNNNANLFLNPLTIRVTVPIGTRLILNHPSGTISLGDIEGELRARLAGRTTLRAGYFTKMALTLRDKSRAIISRMEGDVDVLMTDASKVLVNGRVGRLRAVVEKDGQLEILAPLKKLHAEVNGKGLIQAKNTVDAAQCNVYGHGHVHIAELRSTIISNTHEQGRVDVKKKPSFVPTSIFRGHRQTGA